MQREKEMPALKSNEPDSVMLSERKKRMNYAVADVLTDIDRSHVLSAARRLANLDEKQVNAVSTRIELDLRIGYAFTRFITNNIRPLGGPLGDLTLSYGMLVARAVSRNT